MALWKKIVIGLAATAGFYVVVQVAFLIYLLSGMCVSDPYYEARSPNGKYKAVIYQLDCGALSDFSTQISILRANDALQTKAGNVFSGNGHPRDTLPEVIWRDEQNLDVYIQESALAYKKKESWRWLWHKVNVVFHVK